MDPIPNDAFRDLPKILWENSKVAYNEKLFLVAVKNGKNLAIQAVTPEHMKQICQMFEHNLKEYEEKYGEIKAQWSPNMKSPIQFQAPLEICTDPNKP